MRMILLVLVGSVLAYFGAKKLAWMLADDETQIAWLIEGMEEDFDDATVRGCLKPIAKDWSHEDSRYLDRSTLQQGLASTFFNERNREKQFVIDAEVPEDKLQINVTGDTAQVQATVEFLRLEQSIWKPTWTFRLDSRWEKRDEGWRLVHSSHEDLVGKRF